MGLFNYKTSNPAFTNYFWEDDSRSTLKMTVRGILIKSLVSILVIAFITAYIWKLHGEGINNH